MTLDERAATVTSCAESHRSPGARITTTDRQRHPPRSATGWLLLAVPELVALDLPALARQAGYPGTAVIPAVSYLLSLLALKLTGIRRVSHVDDLAADPGAALFAGLTALPKATALTTYSYRLEHSRQATLLAALGKAMLAANLIADTSGDLDLDFHAIMHWARTPHWKNTTYLPVPNAPDPCSPSSPKTPAPTPSSTPTPT